MVEVRRASPDDAEAIREVARASWHAAYDDLLGEETVERTIEEWYDLDGLRDVIGHSEHIVRVAGSDVVGFVHAGPNPDGGRLIELFRIYVRPDRWDEGIGGRLLESVVTELDAYDRLALGVFVENEVGVGFYESQGFDRVGEQRIEIGGKEYREYRYERPL